jgi:hypothetical protein
MSSRERTAVWVQSHAPIHSQFYSPSIPPSVLDDVSVPSTQPSEAESTRSIPPKMVLKYTDGRPDVPISNLHTDKGLSRSGTKRRTGDSTSRSQTLPYERNGRSRSASHGATEVDRPQPHVSVRHNELRDRHALGSPTPEEIRVWPSHETSPPQHSQQTPRSKSLPRDPHVPEDLQSPPLPMPSHAQLQQGYFSPASHHTHPTLPTHQISSSQSQPIAWHSLQSPSKGTFAPHSSHSSSQKSSSHTPPAIVYAPSHHSKSHYVPPAMYTQYPPPNAPGMTYSHSAPVRYPHVAGTPYPSAHCGSTVLSSVHEEGRSRTKGSARDRALVVTASEQDDSSDTDSNRSGSTYYVIPTAGQKVHIIAPDKSIYTATSTTKSPTSPRSPISGSLKKPFFSRLLERLSPTDSKVFSGGGNRRLQRRHSTGGPGTVPGTVRNRPIDQRGH